MVALKRLLPETYFPTHGENRMAQEGMVEAARNRYLSERPNNLFFLLRNRFEWMNQYLTDKIDVFEIGAGSGFSTFFLKNGNVKLTDVSQYSWIDRYVDATDMPFAKASVDVLICSHMIHHLAYPKKFLVQASESLRPGGLILINEINTSFFMKILLRLMRHEGWSYDTNVFDNAKPANEPSDPWSANCAIPQLLFSNKEKFEEQFPFLRIERFELCEGFIFPLSGGVIAKTATLQLPLPILGLVAKFDTFLIRILPKLFPLGMRVVIRKV